MVHGKTGVVGILNKQLDIVEEKANGPKTVQSVFTHIKRFINKKSVPFTFCATVKSGIFILTSLF